MAEERYKAERLDFFYISGVPGRFSKCEDCPIPAVAIYSASLGVLVETDPNTNILCGGSPEKKSVASIGDEAERRYADLSSELSKNGIKPTEIEVPREFSTWGRALHRAQHPDQSIVDLLGPKQ